MTLDLRIFLYKRRHSCILSASKYFLGPLYTVVCKLKTEQHWINYIEEMKGTIGA